MIRKTTLSLIRFFLFFSIILCTETSSYAQTIVPQPLDGLEKICAGPTFNEFYATFTYVDFPADATFVVELSDKTGSFSSPIQTILLQVSNISPTQQTIKFGVPTNLEGSDVYSLRIKSSTGAVSSRFKNSLDKTSFAAYYKSYQSLYFINKKSASAVICAGSSMTLSVDNDTPDVPGSSPVLNPNLKYKWYKDNVVIGGQSSSSLVINAVGEYYSEIDYGLCTETNISSNHVVVTSSASGSSVTINSSLGNPFCASGTGTVLTATSGNKYQWKKAGVVIVGATNRTYATNESGVYTVDVDFGGCTATGTIDLKGSGFTGTLNVPEKNVIAPEETLSVTVTTDAVNPTFKWYLNNNIIAGATSNTYLVATRGNYKVVISQVGGCTVEQELPFTVSYDTDPTTSVTKIANVISLSSYPYDVWDIPSEYKNANTSVKIISSNGDLVLDVVNYQGDWPPLGSIDIKNVNPVYYYVIQSDTGEKKGSITVIK